MKVILIALRTLCNTFLQAQTTVKGIFGDQKVKEILQVNIYLEDTYDSISSNLHDYLVFQADPGL